MAYIKFSLMMHLIRLTFDLHLDSPPQQPHWTESRGKLLMQRVADAREASRNVMTQNWS